MQERRSKWRARTYYGGVIAFNNRQSTMDCVVRNFSDDGAKLVFANTATIPNEVDLKIPQKEQSYRVRVVWRGALEAGVRFLNEPVSNGPIPFDWARRLRKCEQERAALRQRVQDLSSAE
jgi:hypothetical protein